MGKLRRDAFEHFKEIIWVVFLINLVLVVIFFLFGKYIGFDIMGWISLGFALTIIIGFGSIFAINLLCVLIIRVIRYYRKKQRD